MKIMIVVRSVRSPRSAFWVGDPGWLTVPRQGDDWAHCSAWCSETVVGIVHYGPGQGPGDPNHRITIRSTEDLIDHLIDDHGFTGR
jgi:hypothetical protein